MIHPFRPHYVWVLLLTLSIPTQATVSPSPTPYVVSAAGFNQYAVLTNNLGDSQSTISGNTGYCGSGGGLTVLNNATFAGNFNYTSFNPLSGLSGITFTSGSASLNSNVTNAYNNAYAFSQTLAGFNANANIVFNNGNSQNLTLSSITRVGSLNVVDIENGNFTFSNSLTITGGSNDIFYINVYDQNFNSSNIILTGGVTSKNIYWNFLSAGEGFSNGTFNGTIFDFSQTLQLTSMTINGGVYGYNPELQESKVIESAPAVPEPATWSGAIAALGAIGLLWRSRRK